VGGRGDDGAGALDGVGGRGGRVPGADREEGRGRRFLSRARLTNTSHPVKLLRPPQGTGGGIRSLGLRLGMPGSSHRKAQGRQAGTTIGSAIEDHDSLGMRSGGGEPTQLGGEVGVAGGPGHCSDERGAVTRAQCCAPPCSGGAAVDSTRGPRGCGMRFILSVPPAAHGADYGARWWGAPRLEDYAAAGSLAVGSRR